ncbi:hypothetical protein Syun_024541 [Stephania yunnanensis]|uniref:Uncharacterized protein n=1 Tax=Stephania yunnanensis TaxID=152371 RepID=A0AAP0I4K2_9MAGN
MVGASQFRGAAFIYERFVREKLIKQYYGGNFVKDQYSSNGNLEKSKKGKHETH